MRLSLGWQNTNQHQEHYIEAAGSLTSYSVFSKELTRKEMKKCQRLPKLPTHLVLHHIMDFC